MAVVVVLAASLVASCGFLLVAAGLWPQLRAGWRGRAGGAPAIAVVRAWAARVVVGVVAGGAVWAVTGWPAAAGWVGLLASWLPSLAGRGRAQRAEADRVEALARWTEMLRDQVRVGGDVAQAVTGAARVAPGPIARPAERLAGRLAVGETAVALAAFAAEVDDPMAEVVAAALTMAMSRPTGRLADLLGELARAIREQASVRLRVEADRRRLRTVTWGVLAAVGGWLTVIYVLSGRYLSAYDGAAGQAVLLVAGGAFAAGLTALARMDRLASLPRLALTGEGRR
jgi:Flp pilus assembly protein TadB